jgi:hypothetical protein
MIAHISPQKQPQHADLQKYHLGNDCPTFEGMYRYCQVGGLDGVFGL